MTREEYIAQYGASLTEAEKRYIMAFGAPNVPSVGASRNPSTPGLRVGSAPQLDAALDQTGALWEPNR